MTQHHLVQAPTRARRGPDLGGARVHSPARGPHSPLASPPLSPSRPRLSDAVRPGLPSAAGPTVRAPAAGGRTGGRARTLTRLQRPWRAPLPVGGCDGLRVTATRKAGDRLGPGFTQLRRRSSSSDRPSGSLPLASSQALHFLTGKHESSSYFRVLHRFFQRLQGWTCTYTVLVSAFL